MIQRSSRFLARVALSIGAMGGLAASMLVPTTAPAADVPNPTIVPIAYDAGSKHHPFMSTSTNLAALGYAENEFQMSGTANVYAQDGRWGSNGEWNTTVSQTGVPYSTRLLVRRPIDPANFNGTVIVEWLNVTALFDTDPIWGQTNTELLRDGYAWVGVSAQSVGVAQLEGWDPQRYGTLNLTHDSLSYDIFSQAGQAVRSQASLLLGGLVPKDLIGGGESQSTIYLVTYVNAFQSAISQIYDGILLYSRFSTGAPISNGEFDPGVVYIRADNATKVFQFESEQDVGLFGFSVARQSDTNRLRTWETAGTSHYDAYGVDALEATAKRDLPQVADIAIGCKNPLNQLPMHYVANAAVVAFKRWVENDMAPPQSPRIELTSAGQVVRDTYGNAKGGIRLPEMQVPTATNNYNNGPGSGNVLLGLLECTFVGNTAPFDAATLKALYPTHRAYVSQYTAAAKADLNEGYMLQADYEQTIADAEAANVPGH
jgi:hypothetical protein